MNLFCTQCGHQNEADSSFCEACGKPLTSRGVSQEPGPAPPAARARWFMVTAAIVLLLAAGVFVATVLAPSTPAPPALAPPVLAQLGIGQKPLEQAVVGKWSEVGDPTTTVEFFQDKAFSMTTKKMQQNGKWVVVGERRIKADVSMLGQTVIYLFEDMEISGDKMSGAMTVGNENSGRFSAVRVKDSSGSSKSLDQEIIGKWENRRPGFITAFEFLPDKTVIFTKEEDSKEQFKGKWAVVGKRGVKGEFSVPGKPPLAFVFDNIDISGDKMTLYAAIGNDEPLRGTLTRVK